MDVILLLKMKNFKYTGKLMELEKAFWITQIQKDKY